MNSINFVTGKNLDLERQLKRVKYLRITALASLLIVASISILIFVMTVLLPISSVKKEQDQTLLGISQLHKKLATYVLIKDRLNNISKILGIRKDYPQISNSLVSKLPDGLQISALRIESGQIIIEVDGDSLIPINQFIDEIVAVSDANNHIKNLTVTSLSFNPVTSQYALIFQADML